MYILTVRYRPRLGRPTYLYLIVIIKIMISIGTETRPTTFLTENYGVESAQIIASHIRQGCFTMMKSSNESGRVKI